MNFKTLLLSLGMILLLSSYTGNNIISTFPIKQDSSTNSLFQKEKNDTLVSIKIKGTIIDILPDNIDIIATDILKAAKEFTIINDIKVDNLSVSVSSNNTKFISLIGKYKIQYFFSTPESWNDWGNFKDEDVLYTYYQSEIKNIGEFAEKYKLKKVKNINSENVNETITLYSATPNYFVVLIVEQSTYQCAMHPEINSEKSGSCSICGMDLIHITSH